MFSPYYARARRAGPAEPEAHCAFNAVLYGQRGRRWSMTERSGESLQRSSGGLTIGPSAMRWDGSGLIVNIDEVTVPRPSRLRGTVRAHPAFPVTFSAALDPAGAHHWSPIAPVARIEVDFTQPRLRWRGQGYLDTNWGAAPLEDAFLQWHWSRAHNARGDALILYDRETTSGERSLLALEFGPDGAPRSLPAPARAPLPRTLWRISRTTCADDGRAQVQRTLEDTPFYARSLIAAELRGEPVVSMHESLSLRRFGQAWVQGLLPFRMPRWG